MPFQVIYTSSAAHAMAKEDLTAILSESRERNTRLGVTGMLLYDAGNFLQVLEGEEDAVRPLYNRIKGDDRHSTVVTLRARNVDQRAFADWKMGFRDLTDLPEDEWPEGTTDFLINPSPEAFNEQDASHAYQALLHFRNANEADNAS